VAAVFEEDKSVKSPDVFACARLLKVLAHPTRIMILEELMSGTKCVNDIRDLLEVSQPNVSQHLGVLKENGLVACRKEGVSRCYYLSRPRFVGSLLRSLRSGSSEAARRAPGPRPRGGCGASRSAGGGGARSGRRGLSG
jgi:ArsR family transcriptional regulator